ncbi:hypothetical protein RPYSC3_47800 [Rhodopseudomonas palustris]|nr:hypothetical protein RPYSC3_47800 [Rhodopseudomonas palustris]
MSDLLDYLQTPVTKLQLVIVGGFLFLYITYFVRRYMRD